MIEPSINQTKEWRCNQPWYINGKHNECEKYQIRLIEKATGKKIHKTNKRINLNTGELDETVKRVVGELNCFPHR